MKCEKCEKCKKCEKYNKIVRLNSLKCGDVFIWAEKIFMRSEELDDDRGIRVFCFNDFGFRRFSRNFKVISVTINHKKSVLYYDLREELCLVQLKNL